MNQRKTLHKIEYMDPNEKGRVISLSYCLKWINSMYFPNNQDSTYYKNLSYVHILKINNRNLKAIEPHNNGKLRSDPYSSFIEGNQYWVLANESKIITLMDSLKDRRVSFDDLEGEIEDFLHENSPEALVA